MVSRWQAAWMSRRNTCAAFPRILSRTLLTGGCAVCKMTRNRHPGAARMSSTCIPRQRSMLPMARRTQSGNDYEQANIARLHAHRVDDRHGGNVDSLIRSGSAIQQGAAAIQGNHPAAKHHHLAQLD